ncbi:MAG: tetraacyldisaccharide 4'-kinase, partial [Lacisediminimonas sp.]|nr:tetraacyldisaccharide 4'-kinase [Lacisediminimonas sp.]
KVAVLPVPVIVIGNVFVGGTGKTPLVIWLVRMLCEAGWRPGVISRGYGGSKQVPQQVVAGVAAGQAGDEPVLIASRTGRPVVVGRDRVAAAELLLRLHPDIDIIVSDDGLQHYRLPRQLEIAVFDRRGAGNGWLLPAGPLREPATRPRDFTVINGAASAPGVAAGSAWRMALEPDDAWQLVDPARRMPLVPLCAGRPVLAAAGIGDPGRFFAMLAAIGLQFDALPLPDHYPFERNPFEGKAAHIILVTEKDAVKCANNAALSTDARLWVVPVTAALDGPLIERILERLRGSPPA